MKKIMFNDKFGLTQAVLDGRKTQTRRIVPKEFFTLQWDEREDTLVVENEYGDFVDIKDTKFCMFKVHEIVAVAQSYKDLGYNPISLDISQKDYRISRGTLGESKGWNNKMFVRADACKHQIRITNVRVERLQDISDEDCMAEGIQICARRYYFEGLDKEKGFYFNTQREAYAVLIDKISGKGTWDKNPFVFVYDFELIK
jgi:hypothetical protein